MRTLRRMKPSLVEPVDRRAFKRLIRGRTKRAGLRPLLPFARACLERVRVATGASNQSERYSSGPDAADWAAGVLDALETFVQTGESPSAISPHRYVSGRPPKASAAMRAIVEMHHAACARKGFDKLIVQASLSLIASGESANDIESALSTD